MPNAMLGHTGHGSAVVQCLHGSSEPRSRCPSRVMACKAAAAAAFLVVGVTLVIMALPNAGTAVHGPPAVEPAHTAHLRASARSARAWHGRAASVSSGGDASTAEEEERARKLAEEEEQMTIMLIVFGVVMLCTMLAGAMACLRVARGSNAVSVISSHDASSRPGRGRAQYVVGRPLGMMPTANVPVGTRAAPPRWLPDKAKPSMPAPRRTFTYAPQLSRIASAPSVGEVSHGPGNTDAGAWEVVDLDTDLSAPRSSSAGPSTGGQRTSPAMMVGAHQRVARVASVPTIPFSSGQTVMYYSMRAPSGMPAAGAGAGAGAGSLHPYSMSYYGQAVAPYSYGHMAMHAPRSFYG